MGSISGQMQLIRSGDVEAAAVIWQRYGPRLTNVARRQIPTNLRSIVDGDDLANEALTVVVMGFKEGRWPHVQDRHLLWGLLAKITYNRALHEIKKSRRKRRPPAHAQVPLDDLNVPFVPPEEFDLMAAEQFKILIEHLAAKDKVLETIALLICDRYTYAEIAGKLGCSTRSVARKVVIIRHTLEELELERGQGTSEPEGI